jgi:hypothetical protein
LADGAVDTAAIQDGAVTTAKLAADSVTDSQLADNAVDTAAIQDGAVNAAKLAANSVTDSELAPDVVDETHLVNLWTCAQPSSPSVGFAEVLFAESWASPSCGFQDRDDNKLSSSFPACSVPSSQPVFVNLCQAADQLAKYFSRNPTQLDSDHRIAIKVLNENDAASPTEVIVQASAQDANLADALPTSDGSGCSTNPAVACTYHNMRPFCGTARTDSTNMRVFQELFAELAAFGKLTGTPSAASICSLSALSPGGVDSSGNALADDQTNRNANSFQINGNTWFFYSSAWDGASGSPPA